jgi:hypothetical protein
MVDGSGVVAEVDPSGNVTSHLNMMLMVRFSGGVVNPGMKQKFVGQLGHFSDK